jgi:DNA primase catalytic subunit
VAAERRAIRTYYRSAAASSILLPPESTRRQFRLAIRRPDGKLAFTKVEDRIRRPEVLLRHLARAAPHHAYFTTSTWLDPQRLGPRDLKKAKRGGYMVAHNVFLNQGLYFDIDLKASLPDAAHHLLRLRDLLASRWGFEDFQAVYSGSKGFHLYVLDFDIRDFVKEIEADPRKREDQHPVAKAQFTEAAVKAGIAVDVAVTLDPRRILRVPGTVHGKTLNLCEPVPMARVESFVPRKIPSDGWRKLLG